MHLILYNFINLKTFTVFPKSSLRSDYRSHFMIYHNNTPAVVFGTKSLIKLKGVPVTWPKRNNFFSKNIIPCDSGIEWDENCRCWIWLCGHMSAESLPWLSLRAWLDHTEVNPYVSKMCKLGSWLFFSLCIYKKGFDSNWEIIQKYGTNPVLAVTCRSHFGDDLPQGARNTK